MKKIDAMPETKVVILAAGKSTRMKSGHSKIVHKILGKEIINHQLDQLIAAGIAEENIILVAGENLPELKSVIHRKIQYAIQSTPLGTAHALLSARDYLQNFSGRLLVTVGDNPYITATQLQKLFEKHALQASSCTLLTAIFPYQPPPYGRIIRDESGRVLGVVEEIEATPDQLKIREVNSSIYLFNNEIVFPRLSQIDNHNAKNEYYLTDIIKILTADHYPIEALIADDYVVSIGINHRWDLAFAQQKLNEAHLKKLALEKGVTILQPESVTIELDVEIGQDTIIYPNTYIGAGCRIGKNCQIGPFAYLSQVEIADREQVIMEKRVGAPPKK